MSQCMYCAKAVRTATTIIAITLIGCNLREGVWLLSPLPPVDDVFRSSSFRWTCPNLLVFGKEYHFPKRPDGSNTTATAVNAAATLFSVEKRRIANPWWSNWSTIMSETNASVLLDDSFIHREPLYGPTERPAGIRLAMMGDSITRYQGVSLLHYLHSGYWLDEYIQPNLCNEKTFDNDWSTYYHYMTNFFNGPANFLCDCFRFQTVAHLAADNFYYRDPCRDNHVTFINKLGGFPIRGHWFPHEIQFHERTDEHQLTGGYNETALNTTYTWAYASWVDFMREYLAKLDPRPEVLVINAGMWGPSGLEENGMLAGIRNVSDELGIVSIYKTTTKGKDDTEGTLESHDELGCRLLHHCILMNWTMKMHEDHFFDFIHFRSFSNTRFNEQLLELLAKIRPDWFPATFGSQLISL
jgi:hypothetical protein